MAAAIERVARHGDVVRLTRPPRSAEGKAGMAHTALYSTGRNLGMEQDVRDMAARLDADTGRGLPAQAIDAKVSGLLDQGYPLSAEQIAAIRFVAGSGGWAAIIEGAAGSGKTTTLRPIADLYREQGKTIIATAVAWRTAVALGNDVDARPFCVEQAAQDGGAGTDPDRRRHGDYRRRGGDAVDPVRRIMFCNSPNAMGRRSCSRAIPRSSSRWRRARGCG